MRVFFPIFVTLSLGTIARVVGSRGFLRWRGGGCQSSPTEYKGGLQKLTDDELPTKRGGGHENFPEP